MHERVLGEKETLNHLSVCWRVSEFSSLPGTSFLGLDRHSTVVQIHGGVDVQGTDVSHLSLWVKRGQEPFRKLPYPVFGWDRSYRHYSRVSRKTLRFPLLRLHRTGVVLFFYLQRSLVPQVHRDKGVKGVKETKKYPIPGVSKWNASRQDGWDRKSYWMLRIVGKDR